MSEELLKELDFAELQSKIQTLDERIKTAHPLMPVLLREIHTVLRAQPDNVTLLSEEEIKIIVNGLMKQTSVVFSAKILTSKKSAKSITLADL